MTTSHTADAASRQPDPFTTEDLFGTERRWRRFGEPTPATGTTTDAGTADFGLFGPGSMFWEVLLHPATLVLLNAAQGLVQTRSYKPIAAGLRDRDPLSIKAQRGTVTMRDVYDRLSRNAGMHAPMWLGDTKTAEAMAKHLHNIHKKVAGDVIDIARPQLGGYAASGGRDAMWAALTEIHPMLRIYEAFAFRDGKRPHRLTAAQRDQFFNEAGAYLRLVGAPEEDIPHSADELTKLYRKYQNLFAPSTTYTLIPGTGIDYAQQIADVVKRNFERSHLRGLIPYLLQTAVLTLPVSGALPRPALRSMGLNRRKQAAALVAAKLALPVMYLLQKPPFERYVLRRMWGPDAINLIESARHLHRTVGPDSREASARQGTGA